MYVSENSPPGIILIRNITHIDYNQVLKECPLQPVLNYRGLGGD